VKLEIIGIERILEEIANLLQRSGESDFERGIYKSKKKRRKGFWGQNKDGEEARRLAKKYYPATRERHLYDRGTSRLRKEEGL